MALLTIYHGTSKLSTMVKPVFLATCLLTAAPVMSSGEEGIVHKAVQVVSETAKTVSTKTGEAWDETKQSAGEFAEAVSDSATAAGDYTREKSSEAWDATKEAGTKIVDATEEIYEKVKDAVTSDSGTGVVVEVRSVE